MSALEILQEIKELCYITHKVKAWPNQITTETFGYKCFALVFLRHRALSLSISYRILLSSLNPNPVDHFWEIISGKYILTWNVIKAFFGSKWEIENFLEFLSWGGTGIHGVQGLICNQLMHYVNVQRSLTKFKFTEKKKEREKIALKEFWWFFFFLVVYSF